MTLFLAAEQMLNILKEQNFCKTHIINVYMRIWGKLIIKFGFCEICKIKYLRKRNTKIMSQKYNFLLISMFFQSFRHI